jgi:hypothetical protein
MTFLDNIDQVITLYPLAVGFVGGYSDGDRTKSLRYLLAFVLGLSLTFTALGSAVGLLGTMSGILGGPWYQVAGAIAPVMGSQRRGLHESICRSGESSNPNRAASPVRSCWGCSSVFGPRRDWCC